MRGAHGGALTVRHRYCIPAWASTATVPVRTATAGAAFSLYAVGAVGAYLEWPVYPGQGITARGTGDRLFRICYCDIPTLGYRLTLMGRFLAYVSYLRDRVGVWLGVPFRSFGAGAGVVELGLSARYRSTAAAETRAISPSPLGVGNVCPTPRRGSSPA